MLKTPSIRRAAWATPFIAITLAAAQAPAGAQSYHQVLPVREMAPYEQGALSGMAALTSAGLPFKVAATARVSAYNQPYQANTERKTTGAAAVYAGTHGSNPPKLPTWPSPGAGGLLDFQDKGNLAQAWATTGQTGIPYLFVTGYGDFKAEATAAWNATLTVPSGTSREVVVRFVVPPVGVSGMTKGDAKAHWRSRMRADFLVNGFPAWSTEAIRLTANPMVPMSAEVKVLQQFGAALSFPTNDEDSDPNNNTETGSTEGPSDKRIVYLTLGRVPGGTVLELSMSLRGTAMTVPTGNRCTKPEDVWACSNATMTVHGSSGEGPLFYLLP